MTVVCLGRCPISTAKTDIGKWHNFAFSRSSDLMRRVVALAGTPSGGIHNTPGQKRIMFVMDRGIPRIDMGEVVQRSCLSHLEKLVWRHEYGHYLDHWINGFKDGPCSFHDLALRRAILADNRAILMRAGLLGSRTYRLQVALRTNRVLYGLLKRLHSLSPIERQIWMDWELQGFGLTLGLAEEALESDEWYRGFAKDQFSRLVLLLTALKRRDPLLFGEQVLKWRKRSHQESCLALVVADFFGAMTGNIIGYGHTDEYYRESPMRQGGEAFANALVLLWEKNVFWSRLLAIMAPRFVARLMIVLRRAQEDHAFEQNL
ncbi:MAG: hypothetical protein HQM01_14300 [Magnetococcales bacterium]|nr:hypothetical protein [Magnetococcales bacterium]